MSVNKHLPHVLVLPEDDANRQLANGFQRELDWTRQWQMQVLPVAGGWLEVLNHFQSDQIADMSRNSNRFMVLLIDFDNNDERLDDARKENP